jgi:hypothetical protein
MALSNDWAQQADVSDSSVCGNVSKKKQFVEMKGN